MDESQRRHAPNHRSYGCGQDRDAARRVEAMTEDELRDACLHAAATIVLAYALGCEFEDCRLDADGRVWPVALSVVEIKYPDNWRGRDDFVHVAMIHEAGAMAVAKSHGRSPHINIEDSDELFHNSLVPDASFST